MKKIKVPKDFPVRPLKPGEPAKDRVTCGSCGLSWDDAIITTWTPAPSARCPFEYFHTEEEPRNVKNNSGKKCKKCGVLTGRYHSLACEPKPQHTPALKGAKVSFVETFKETKNFIDFEFSDGHLLSFRLPEDTAEGHAIVHAVNAYEKDQEIKRELLNALKTCRYQLVDHAKQSGADYVLKQVDKAIARAEGK